MQHILSTTLSDSVRLLSILLINFASIESAINYTPLPSSRVEQYEVLLDLPENPGM